jgi:hypothetical protein
MKRLTTQFILCIALLTVAFQTSFAQCFELGTATGQLTPVLKTTTNGFCPSTAQPSGNCDCPPGFVAVGYEGLEGNLYGTMVLSQFKLRCKQLNANGTLGASVSVTCANGTHPGTTNDGPVDAAAGQALVGAEVRIGCAMDAVMGKTKLLSEILAGLPNATSNNITGIGGTGGAPAAPMYVPNGSVIVGMATFVEPGNNPAGSTGIVSGVAWRYKSVNNVACASACAISAISVSNISACNNQGTQAAGDDTFTANVTVTFSTPATSGTLNLTGDGTASVAVGSLGATSHTFTGVTMSADGTPINLTATFSATPACTLSNSNAGTAPASCSVAPPSCAISGITTSSISVCNNNGTPNNATDDTFTANVTVTFSNAPASGVLNLTGSAVASVPVGSLGATSFTFTGLTMPANGQLLQFAASFSANTACSASNANAGTAPPSCSSVTASVPTMSQWGLILFALIVFSMSVVFGTKQQQALSIAQGNMDAAPRNKSTFDTALFMKVLPFVYAGFAVVLAAAMTFGYQITSADIPGSLLSGAVVAYLIQFVIKSTKSNN